ncbi:Fur family transcriptional regulator [Flagellimonas meridianipacifica]|uniref:Fur family ferric uptake transcriptional regulator n=1 Tax=Flagellimonas meridianipacifica TaxID=1080225 RepID=A0A2T0MIY3_9FLAO|nr:transcriptional repressor [Allomuricauda pacifica]PRX57466.1 Fur family ferric uptake transcriptional regulator [Allomuricauda pacifica]
MEKMSFGQILEEKGLKKTKVRMALLHHFLQLKHAQSYNDLQLALKNEIDKSTLYRNLTSFEQAGIIHRINDHSGTSKYAFGELPKGGQDHAHFVCENCETVYCMEVSTPLQLNVPKGFKTKNVQTIIKGICSKC